MIPNNSLLNVTKILLHEEQKCIQRNKLLLYLCSCFNVCGVFVGFFLGVCSQQHSSTFTMTSSIKIETQDSVEYNLQCFKCNMCVCHQSRLKYTVHEIVPN